MASDKNKAQIARRNNRGELVSASAGICLIIMILAVSALFLVNAGLATYYKQRLGYVADQLSTLAANEIQSPFFSDVESVKTDIKAKAEILCRAVGLPNPATIDVEANYGSAAPGGANTDQSPVSMSVSISVAGLQLVGNGNLLPAFIALSDSSAALVDTTRPKYCTMVTAARKQCGVRAYVPCYSTHYFLGSGSLGELGKIGNPPAHVHGSVSSQLGVGSVASADGSRVVFRSDYTGGPFIGASAAMINYPDCYVSGFNAP